MTITQPADMTECRAAQFDAFSHPVRLRLLHLIAEHSGSLCVEELASRVDIISQPVIVYHLRKMYQAGILSHRKDKLYTFYSLRPEGLSDMQHELDRLLWQHTKAAAEARRI